MARNTKTYKDVNLHFGKHPITGDVTMNYDEEAVKASIRNLIMTSHFERPFHSEIGSRIKALLFEPITPMLYGIIKQEVINLVSTYEPRALILDVMTTYLPNQNTININIVFQINGTSIIGQTNVVLERTR